MIDVCGIQCVDVFFNFSEKSGVDFSINLAVASERFQNQAGEIDILKQQHELRLKHLHSEKRWVQLIDQARSETKNLQKKYDEAAHKQKDQVKELQNNLVKLQDSQTIAQTTLTHKNEIINTQSKQLAKAQSDDTLLVSELAVLKSKLAGENTRKVSKKPLERA